MKPGRRLLPAPLLSASLVAMWVMLARSYSPGQVLLGVVVALLAPAMVQGLRPTPVRIRKPWVITKFIFSVGWDVLKSNAQVGWGVLVWSWRQPDARFVTIPLDLRDPNGLAALAMVTTVVPGTVWSELALDRSSLRLHVWDVGDDEAFIARYKARYELPLKEIFES